MTLARVTGVLAPVTSPFGSSGDIDTAALKKNIAKGLADGLAGVVIAGSTGEAPLLERDEQRRLTAAAREVVPIDRILLVGTGAESTRAAIALSRDAAAERADAVLVRPPGYYSPMLDAAAVRDHLRAVADASPVPVLLYNIPKYAPVPITLEILAGLQEHRNIIGIKDSSGDPANLAAYRATVPVWSVLVGSASHFKRALDLKCEGGILGAACFAAAACVALKRAVEEGDAAEAEGLQSRIAILDREIVGKLGPAGIKVAMDCVGLIGGAPRSPLRPLRPGERDRVAALVAA
ncbi:MAG TPA: dihydrodipicolinate synthase family protein [Gemmatimonadales bacterium]|nr:dihydrodipicolinate synthase family protein [Gemmatimonadales bacterium]